jgi:hypothetical protein
LFVVILKLMHTLASDPSNYCIVLLLNTSTETAALTECRVCYFYNWITTFDFLKKKTGLLQAVEQASGCYVIACEHHK